MSKDGTGHGPAQASHEAGHDEGTRKSYLIGFLLSVVLTAIPFWLAMTGVLDTGVTAAIIVIMAVIQIGVHTVFFLHVNSKSEGGWTLVSLVFTGIIVVIVISGSLWIMYHLHGNMMPMAPPPAASPETMSPMPPMPAPRAVT